MYNESYDDYIRSILGYPMVNNYNTYNMNNNCQEQNMEINKDLEECCPKIYRIVYPMVCKVCNNNTKPITKQLIDSMTNEIYMAIEGNEEVNININLSNNIGNSVNNRSGENTQNSMNNSNKKMDVKVENRSGETRQIGGRNFVLNDLIRILLIRELLGGNNQRPPRPPVRPPMRPNFPGGMGPGPGGRPPFMPRDFQDNYDIYEY